MGRAALATVVVSASLLASCVAPARTTASYEGKAADTADAVVSASRTVLVAVSAARSDGLFAPTTAVTIADAESDASAARDAFTSIQPPDATSDRIRAQLLADVERAIDVIELVRIAARRADDVELPRIAAPLRAISGRLDRFASRYG
jgi:hypothetical protein